MSITWKMRIVLVAAIMVACCLPLAAQSYTFEAISCDGATPAPYAMNGAGTAASFAESIDGGQLPAIAGKSQSIAEGVRI